MRSTKPGGIWAWMEELPETQWEEAQEFLGSRARWGEHVCLMRYGSHLYGTQTAQSDLDYRGIALPTTEQVCLGNIPKTWRWTSCQEENEKNTPGDVDIEIYSLQHFVKLLLKGKTVALDMIHCNNENLLWTSPAWMFMVQNRHRAYTKNLNAFVGYAKRQAAKYGIKGSRLAAMNEFLTVLMQHSWGPAKEDSPTRLQDVWDKLPQNDHCKFVEDSPNGLRQYQICGCVLQERMTFELAGKCVSRLRSAYGARAEAAKRNEGIDWKAISHALRAAMEVREILLFGNIEFPLREAEFLKKVKAGQLDFVDVVQPRLEAMLSELETLSANSELPEEPDRWFWEDFVAQETLKSLPRAGSDGEKASRQAQGW